MLNNFKIYETHLENKKYFIYNVLGHARCKCEFL